jgi:hypothetical protein
LDGSVSSISFVSKVLDVALRVSTSGAAPVTVIVSSTAPTCIETLTFAVNAAGNSIPSRLTTLKPGNVNVTVYTPGRRSLMM